MDVSVIIPVYNAAEFLDECLASIFSQELSLQEAEEIPRKDASPVTTRTLTVELSIFNDSSTDGSRSLIDEWATKFQTLKNFSVLVTDNEFGKPGGVGYAKNRAVVQSSGTFLCFCDADDIMEPTRILDQYQMAFSLPDAIVGSQFTKLPLGSTQIFTRWANFLTQEQLYTQIYQSFGPTLVMPTWFCHRDVFNNIPRGFSEQGRAHLLKKPPICIILNVGVPEDLIFFYEHLNRGGKLRRVDKNLMVYRYHTSSATFSVKEPTIWAIRLQQFESNILSLSNWSQFSIWGGGKLGRRFFRSLSPDNQKRVIAFADVDEKKIGKEYQPHPNPLKLVVPIISIKNITSPFVVCIKTEFTWDPEGPFLQTVKHKGFVEGQDFYLFS